MISLIRAELNLGYEEILPKPLHPQIEIYKEQKSLKTMYDPTKPYKQQVLDIIRSTWETPYVKVKPGAYPIIIKKFSGLEVDHTDGIGTKGVYHWAQRTFRNASLDALAMNLNDLALARAIPYKLQNHIIIPEDDKAAIIEIVETLAEECRKRKIAITGGEISIHNNTQGIDISMTVSGFIKKDKPNQLLPGDTLIGLRSSGLHSNGFTKVREVFGDDFRPEFVEPTKIYLDDVLRLDKKYDIHGMMHITGGAYTKLKDVLHNADAVISKNHYLYPQKIFLELYKRGISDQEMYKTFNCGIGFVLGVPQKQAERTVSFLNREQDAADIIGRVVAGKGVVRIESAFSDKGVEY
jgi:phosphoribosylformylglycinamidine cyclo-ligase